MRIEHLVVENFKGFANREFSFHPEFNLIVGDNGTGKTSVLEAISIAAGSWFLGLRGYDTRHIRSDEVLLKSFVSESRVHWEHQYPCAVEAQGEIIGQPLSWRRALNTPHGRTTYGEARTIKDLAAQSDDCVRKGDEVVLPLISYYSTGRLWNVPREQARIKSDRKIQGKETLSRLAGYRNSVDPRLSVTELVSWIARQSWMAFQQKGERSPIFEVARAALIHNIQGAKDVYFDAELGEVVVDFVDDWSQPFNNLSDGQRCMLALVGDIARKAAILNPHLAGSVLSEIPGVVLIDELDLHLHPKWQRHVINNLRATFPKLQFFCSTHSPFLIQSLRSGEELLMLDGQPPAQLEDQALDQIARGVQGVADPQVSARYERMKDVALDYLQILEEASMAPEKKLAKYKERLAEAIAPYADNPAFQAFLELKRVVKLGE